MITPENIQPRKQMSPRLGAIGCILLVAIFAAVAWSAVSGKSATWDEPGHTVAGWFMLWQRDFRISPDVPPLWEDWIGLGLGPGAVHFSPDAPAYQNLRTKNDQFVYDVTTLYHTPGNDGIALVNRGRVMALILGVVLAAMICIWAWQLGGPIAALAATFVFCLDPNFLGHAPLVKNDVGFTLAFFAASYALWRVGKRLTFWNATAFALLTAIALAVKLSGILLAPLAMIALLGRAMMPAPWRVLGTGIARLRTKLLVAAALCFFTFLIIWLGLWTAYGWRFDAGPNGLQTDTKYYVRVFRQLDLVSRLGRQPTPAEQDAWQTPLTTRAALYLEEHHLLPQAWVSGFVLTQSSGPGRPGFLNGNIYEGGRWYYFFFAAIYKLPLATLVALLLTLLLTTRRVKRGALRENARGWDAIALAAPVAIYAVAAVTADMNVGLRHVFPVLPFLYVGIGLAAARAWRPGLPGQATPARITIMILSAALAAETGAAFPNYIAFFNIASASHRLSLLSDSNLDWGQDLPLLKAWQDAHPNTVLYLEYFGLCDPAAYGIRYQNIPGGYLFGPPKAWPDKPGVVAISASSLQQVYTTNRKTDTATYFQNQKPLAILGETIYLFDYGPDAKVDATASATGELK